MRSSVKNSIDYKSLIDNSFRPQDDFYGYVNNKWLATNPIPKSESRWGTFVYLQNQSFKNMREIYKNLVGKDFRTGSIEQIARDFYESGMKIDDYRSQHLSLISGYFDKINSIKNKSELWGLIGELNTIDTECCWGVWVGIDDKESTHYILHFTQPDLTLPNRDYYIVNNQSMESIRQKYQAHAKKIFAHFPDLASDVNDFWKIIWKFEYGLAKISRSNADLRDVKKNYHKTTFANLSQMYPSINWVNYAKAFGWDTTCRLTIDQPEVFAYINQIAEKYSLEDWKTYLKWTFIVDNCEFIDNQYAFLWFEFFGKTFGGTKIMMPLWKRVIIQMDKLVGEDVGRLYIEKFFPASSKRLALKMVEDMRQTFKKRLLKLDWMSQPSKQIALLKLANLKVLIGYPDRWRDYQELEIKQQSYLANILSAAKFQTAYYMNKLSQPASRDEWLMSPQTVNAYNDPRRLVICFPAAILQPPFFDPNAHIAINLGGMGTVICHELTHAFDDEGCMFDENGNVRPWQTKEDRNAFSKRAQVIIDQANDFEVLPGLHIIGKLVIGESIADLGGVEIAYDMLSGKIKSKLNQLVANNLTASQLFYINHAFYHCAFIRKAKIRELVLNNEHPDEHFRVNGILANCDNFYKTFNIKPGDKLYRPPSKRAKIW